MKQQSLLSRMFDSHYKVIAHMKATRQTHFYNPYLPMMVTPFPIGMHKGKSTSEDKGEDNE